MSAFEIANRVMLRDPNHSVTVTYVPATGPTSRVRAVLAKKDDVSQILGARVVRATHVMQVLVKDAPNLTEDDKFILDDGTTYLVDGLPTKNGTRDVWQFGVAE